jgi:phosphoribosylcarboxyaminoimidazole (NCAIR) mutase
MLATTDGILREKLHAYREKQTQSVLSQTLEG